MPSSDHDQRFAELMFPNAHTMLDEAIDWIRSNLSPDDVFTEKELGEWAESNGWSSE